LTSNNGNVVRPFPVRAETGAMMGACPLGG